MVSNSLLLRAMTVIGAVAILVARRRRHRERKRAHASPLALDGGIPACKELIPYSKQTITQQDVDAVVACLRDTFLTTGPRVEQFELETCSFTGARHGVACSNGTAALHMAVFAAGVGPGDEVIVPSITFVASSNAVLYLGGTVVFADVVEATLNMDTAQVAKLITPRTKAVIAVDMCGQPADLAPLLDMARRHGLVLIEDASHSAGATYQGARVGSIADITTFSFHPVKNMTTGEGGMTLTNNDEFARRMRSFRSHGIDLDFRKRQLQPVPHRYDMAHLGYNYRLTDLQCALGIAQLKRISQFVTRRQQIAAIYGGAFKAIDAIDPLVELPDRTNAHHLYVIRLRLELLQCDRDQVFKALRAENVGVNVHYMPVQMHSFYSETLGYGKQICPRAQSVYSQVISLPCFPSMSNADVDDVIAAVTKVANAYKTQTGSAKFTH